MQTLQLHGARRAGEGSRTASRIGGPPFRLRSLLAAAAVALSVALGLAPTAEAQLTPGTLDASRLASALAIPYLTSSGGPGERITVATVTNGLVTVPISLHLVFISGDEGDAWSAFDFSCSLTPLETTWFVFERDGDGATVSFECSETGVLDGTDPDAVNNVVTRAIPGSDGILFVTLECQVGQAGCPAGPFGLRTRDYDALFGDATVFDYGQGFSFSVSAIGFQAGSNQDGDRLYEFDGTDYSSFPSFLTTQYVAPTDDITLELLLFTLDGKIGQGEVGAGLFALAFDDDENMTSGVVNFECFTLRDMTSDAPEGFGENITHDIGGHIVGHLELFTISRSATTDVHELEAPTGNGTGARRRPVVGWVIQTVGMFGDVAGTGNRFSAPAAWARPLISGSTPLVPEGPAANKDVPALNAGP